MFNWLIRFDCLQPILIEIALVILIDQDNFQHWVGGDWNLLLSYYFTIGLKVFKKYDKDC